MFRKMIVFGLAVSMLFALTTPATVLARPPYAFGGGERAIHFNENGTTPTAAQPTHINTIQQGYDYGAFLGVLTVERLGRTVNVYGGATMEAMDFGGGHFSFTGLNVGNTALIGHNRGSAGFFSFVRLLQYGDIITLDMGGIVRTYEVFLRTAVYETDFSSLQQFGDNRLTLITCVEYVRNQRRVVSAIEIQEGV
ncbi:MAG: sortase [Defluviitaleaceae bacterium]|nr:sortase [Defluviitaleaceae bacterium]